MWFLLLLVYYLKFANLEAASLGPGRVPYSIPIAKQTRDENQMVLSLPEGFNPPRPPIDPLMYPFHADDTYSDWRPIIPRPWLKPPVENEEKPKIPQYSNHRYESVAFGPWQPVSPLLMEHLPTERQIEDVRVNVTPKEDRNYVLIGGRSRANYNTKNNTKTALFNQTIGLQLNKKNILEITTVTEESQKSMVSPTAAAATSSNIWPKDFIEQIGTAEKTRNDHLDVNEPENDLLDTFAMDITRLGVPFENRNSSDKASICVPLTVQEQKSSTDIVEIDRVYCFPLPSDEQESNNFTITTDETISNATDRSDENNIVKSTISAAKDLKLKYLYILFAFWSTIIVIL